MEQNASALPKVTLGQYKGLDFTRRVRPVSEKAVELEASNLTRTHAPFVPVKLPAARGMRVTLDFEGFLDGAPIPDSRMENVTVVLGTGQLMPAAENAVYGPQGRRGFPVRFYLPRRVPGAGAFRQNGTVCHCPAHRGAKADRAAGRRLCRNTGL